MREQSRNVVFRHSVAEGVAGHLEEAAGFGDVAGGLVQRFFEHLFLHLFER